MAYAETTTVPFTRSIAETLEMIRARGADQLVQAESRTDTVIQFTLEDRMVRFRLPLPTLDQMPKYDGRRRDLTPEQRNAKLEQAKRQRARALMLVIKAKLESVESGIETFEQAFLANVVTASGQTVHEAIQEKIADEYATGQPSVFLLPPPAGASE